MAHLLDGYDDWKLETPEWDEDEFCCYRCGDSVGSENILDDDGLCPQCRKEDEEDE
ncbi:MAG TPA: hypothetical protein VI911_12190 [Patescibacteria group bacterium]|nr:hypothetical protein [Patescibacteria group bacterium]